MLSAEGASSFFVAAEDTNSDHEYYGLTSMAELIISLNRKIYERATYAKFVKAVYGKAISQDAWKSRVSKLPEDVSTVEITVERFAGGQPAGATG